VEAAWAPEAANTPDPTANAARTHNTGRRDRRTEDIRLPRQNDAAHVTSPFATAASTPARAYKFRTARRSTRPARHLTWTG